MNNAPKSQSNQTHNVRKTEVGLFVCRLPSHCLRSRVLVHCPPCCSTFADFVCALALVRYSTAPYAHTYTDFAVPRHSIDMGGCVRHARAPTRFRAMWRWVDARGIHTRTHKHIDTLLCCEASRIADVCGVVFGQNATFWLSNLTVRRGFFESWLCLVCVCST